MQIASSIATMIETDERINAEQKMRDAVAKAEAPGVYVADKKIGSVGLRIKKGCSYHGLSLNNNMDLTPFSYINPCGYEGLQVIRLADLGVHIKTYELAIPVVNSVIQAL